MFAFNAMLNFSPGVASMVRKVGLQDQVVLIGGLARNLGFIDSLKRSLDTEVHVPQDPEFVGALGAALVAAVRAGEGR